MKIAIKTALAAVMVSFVLMPTNASSQGIAGAYSLKIPPSARANGMGQSYVALSDDATSMWWNPAGMAMIEQPAIDLMHSQLVPDLASDVFFEYLGGIYNIGGGIMVGGAVQYLTYGEWQATGEQGENLGTESSYEVAPVVGGAMKFMENLSIGINFKFVYIHLADAQYTQDGKEGKGSSVAVDLGGIWKVPSFEVLGYRVERLNLGACLSNFGPSISYIDSDQAAPLPRTFRGGFAYTPVMDELARLTFASDIERELVISDVSNIYHVGSEFVYSNLFAVRAGYIHDKDGKIKDATYGLGFIFNNRIRVDYASVPQSEELGRVHRWSIGVTF